MKKEWAILTGISIAILVIAGLLLSPLAVSAKGGGARAFSGVRSSTRSFSASKTTAPKIPQSSSKAVAPAKTTSPKVVTPSKRPSSATEKVVSQPKTINGKRFSGTGNKVGDGYQPTFRGGYSAPAGSVVYYRESSMMDWLPFYLILSSSNAHREATVVEPAKDGQPGKETVVQEEGVDTMYVVNWIITILFILGLIALIVYLINKYSSKNKPTNSGPRLLYRY